MDIKKAYEDLRMQAVERNHWTATNALEGLKPSIRDFGRPSTTVSRSSKNRIEGGLYELNNVLKEYRPNQEWHGVDIVHLKKFIEMLDRQLQEWAVQPGASFF